MSRDDTVLVQQVLDGNRQAYESLVERYKGIVFARVVGQTGSFAGAEEIVQDAFVEAYLSLDALREPARFPSWLCGIASNVCRHKHRTSGREVAIDEGDRAPSVNATHSEGVVLSLPTDQLPDAVVEADEMATKVTEAIEELPEKYREAILLHYMEGLTYAEMANVLDIPESTVRGRLQVGRDQLREELMPLVQEALEEQRPTSKLTKKVMALLPPLAIATTVSAATGVSSILKGGTMIKALALVGGIVGTGLYFSGIVTVLRWEREPAPTAEVRELAMELTDAGRAPSTSEAGGVADTGAEGDAGVESAAPSQGSGSTHQMVGSGAPGASRKGKTKAGFRMEHTAKDSVISIAYWLPRSVYPDSAYVEITLYDVSGTTVAKSVKGSHSPGTYATQLHKRDLPDGTYFAVLRVNRTRQADVRKMTQVFWDGRN